MAKLNVQSQINKPKPSTLLVEVCSAYVATRKDDPTNSRVVLTGCKEVIFVNPDGYNTYGSFDYLKEAYDIRDLRADESLTIKGNI